MAFRQIDGAGPAGLLLGPTSVPPETRAALQERFVVLLKGAGLSQDTVLEFRSIPSAGANAFAFPGGPVLLTDQLVQFAQDTDPHHALDALTGVLAHEVTHVSERHGLRRLFRISGASVTFAVLMGDMGSLLDQVSVLASLVLDRGYSRDFEREADRGAVLLLGAAGYDTEPLRRLTAALGEARGGAGRWISTHPGFEERGDILSGQPMPGARLSFE
nr:M48 family metallopeptidase [Phaeovibrio sulfidiphilus]